MGRKKLWGGAAQIDRAEEFFRESGDYRYVALAIGSRPLDQPKWAMWACVRLRLKSEALSALGSNVIRIEAILDTAVWFLDQHQTDRFDQCQSISDPSARAALDGKIKPMPLERAFRKAIDHIRPDLAGKSNEQPIAALDSLKKAWGREMKDELVDWELAGLEPDGPTLDGFRTTHRIARVLMQYHASEYPDNSFHFHDPDLLIWIAKEEGML